MVNEPNDKSKRTGGGQYRAKTASSKAKAAKKGRAVRSSPSAPQRAERKQATDAVIAGRLFAEAIVETIRQPLLILDGDLLVHSANRAFYALFDVAPEETKNCLISFRDFIG